MTTFLYQDRDMRGRNRSPRELTAQEVAREKAKRAALDDLERRANAREQFEERAAIMEYDGGLTREEAERRARESVNGMATEDGQC